MDVHFLPDELQAAVDGTFGLDLVLLQEHGPDELVDLLAVLELLELALHAQVLRLLGLELLAGGDDRLQFWRQVGISMVAGQGEKPEGKPMGYKPCWSLVKSSERDCSLACMSAIFNRY